MWYMFNISYQTGWKCPTCVFSSSDAPQHIRVAWHLGRNYLCHDQWIGTTSIFLPHYQHCLRRCTLVSHHSCYNPLIAVLFLKITFFFSMLQRFTSTDKDLIRQTNLFLCLMIVVMAFIHFVTVFLQVCSYSCCYSCKHTHTHAVNSVKLKGLSFTGA